MTVRTELPTVIAFTGESLRHSVKHLTNRQARRVLQAIKECLIIDQSFFDASLLRDAEGECALSVPRAVQIMSVTALDRKTDISAYGCGRQ